MDKLRPENEHLLEEARGDVYGAESQESVVMMLAELRQENQTLKNLLDHSSFFQQFMAQEDVWHGDALTRYYDLLRHLSLGQAHERHCVLLGARL